MNSQRPANHELPSFHVYIHALPKDARRVRLLTLQGQTLLGLEADQRSGLGVPFEFAANSLRRIAGVVIEPDGSFVWVSNPRGLWQLEGVLYDRGDSLDCVELKGCCPDKELGMLLQVLRDKPAGPLMFHWLPEGVLLDEAGFHAVTYRHG